MWIFAELKQSALQYLPVGVLVDVCCRASPRTRRFRRLRRRAAAPADDPRAGIDAARVHAQ